ncbi:SDR family oxidoreductase [Mycobacterium avium subsp. hominissuis]|nr:SDR family oxidoreductase [Mycobacterium avium subsp. hominissuis]
MHGRPDHRNPRIPRHPLRIRGDGRPGQRHAGQPRRSGIMSGRLQDKVAVVTGSTRGIGRAIAVRFAAEGASVVVTGRSLADGADTAADIENWGGKAVFVSSDLEAQTQIEQLIDEAVQRFGRLDVLVNNGAATDLAGPGGVDAALLELDTARWDAIVRGCATTVLWSSQAALPHMITGGGGSIVNVSSAASIRATPAKAAYSAAKASVEALTRSIAVDYAAQGIRANTLVLGFVVSRPSHEALAADPVTGPALRGMQLTRLGTPEDVAAAALFLASDEAGFITGTSLVVDGGATCRMPIPDLSTGRSPTTEEAAIRRQCQCQCRI